MIRTSENAASPERRDNAPLTAGGLIIDVGEKLGEFYWGPLLGGGIESWHAISSRSPSCCSGPGCAQKWNSSLSTAPIDRPRWKRVSCVTAGPKQSYFPGLLVCGP